MHIAALAAILLVPYAFATPIAEPLIKGISTIAAPGTPGAVLAMNDHAAPIVMGRLDKTVLGPVVVAAEWGKGHIVAFGHSGYIDEAQLRGETATFMQRSIVFAAGNVDAGTKIVVGVVDGQMQNVPMTGIEWKRLDGNFADHLSEVKVLVLGGRELSPPQREAIGAWIVKGGGLIAAQTGWGWKQIKNGADMRTNSLNILLEPAGIAWTDETVDKTSKDGFDLMKRPKQPENAAAAIALLVRSERADSTPQAKAAPEDLKSAAALATQAARLLPVNNEERTHLRSLLESHQGKLIPSEKNPLDDKHPLLRFLLALQMDDLRDLPPEQVKPHPAAATFPGGVPEGAPRVKRTVDVDTSIPRWHSLGLYAPPGAVITATLRGDAKAPNGLSIRIGAHTDHLWHLPAWKRVPEISMSRRLEAHTPLKIASPFGGIVYVEVPGNRSGIVQVEIDGAVESPLFVLGKTPVALWQSTVRNAPGPWAELACDSVIVTVPSSSIRNIDDPTEICTIWQQVLDNAADLGSIPRKRSHPQRYTADVQISAGYMHSGYPIMTHLDAVDDMTQAAKLKAGSWGLFHELGHNHQESDWTFEGTGEVTNNLWSLYLMETIAGKGVGQGHDATDLLAKRNGRAAKYLDGGADFTKWKSDPFLALEMYIQIREAFGWEPFKKVFAEYRTLKKGEHPQGDEAKHDQWMVRMSRAVGKNLGPFFTMWGVPTSETARASIRELPTWMPEKR